MQVRILCSWDNLILIDQDEIPNGDVLYQAGYLDVDGSLPCVDPGSYLFFNTPSIVSHECEYRSNWNMW